MKKKTVWLLIFVLLLSFVPAPCTTVQAASKKAKLNVKKLNMTLGNEFRLRVYNLKKKQNVTYTSSNEDIISVTSIGTRGKTADVNALSTGSATVVATVRRGKKVVRKLKCQVKVTPAAFSIKFRKRTIHMNISDRAHLETIIKPNTSTEQPIFESDNPDIVAVSCHGVVTALASGKATITATLLSSGLTATCTVDVSLPQQSVEEKPAKIEKKTSQTGVSLS